MVAATCTIRQLKAVMSLEQWQALSDAVAAANNWLLSDYFAHLDDQIPADSPYVLELAAEIGLDAAAVEKLVAKAATLQPQD